MNIDPSEMKFHYIAFNLHVVYKITNNYTQQGDSNMFCNTDMHIDNFSIMIWILSCCHIVLLKKNRLNLMQMIYLIYWLRFVLLITPWLPRNCKTNVDMHTLVRLYSSIVEIHNHETQSKHTLCQLQCEWNISNYVWQFTPAVLVPNIWLRTATIPRADNKSVHQWNIWTCVIVWRNLFCLRMRNMPTSEFKCKLSMNSFASFDNCNFSMLFYM